MPQDLHDVVAGPASLEVGRAVVQWRALLGREPPCNAHGAFKTLMLLYC